MLRRNTIFVSAIVPRRLIAGLGGFATDCYGTEDYDLWLRILESGSSVLAVREPLVWYRLAESSVSANVVGMARATQIAFSRAIARGNLNKRQRQIARRQIRLQRLVERWEQAVRKRAIAQRTPWLAVARVLPLGARVIIERPNRWARWLRIAFDIARGGPLAGVDRSRAV